MGDGVLAMDDRKDSGDSHHENRAEQSAPWGVWIAVALSVVVWVYVMSFSSLFEGLVVVGTLALILTFIALFGR